MPCFFLRVSVLLISLPHGLCRVFQNHQIVFVQRIEDHIQPLSAIAARFRISGVEKLIDGNPKQRHDLIEYIEFGMMAFVFQRHDASGGTAYEFAQTLLRQPLHFSLSFDLQPQTANVKRPFAFIHIHITLYHCIFRVRRM